MIEALDLTEATLVGHSTGGGEVARYIGCHGTKRVAKAVLVAAVPPIMLKSAANPEGLPMEVFDNLRSGITKDRSQFYEELVYADAPGMVMRCVHCESVLIKIVHGGGRYRLDMRGVACLQIAES